MGALEEQLLRGGGAAVEAWLDCVDAGDAHVPASFNWLGVAEEAAASARQSAAAPDLAWARAAVRLYDRLAGADEGGRDAFEQSAMLLRAWLIVRLGPAPGDSLLDPAFVMHWFFARLNITPAEAARLAREPRGLPLPELRRLRRIKNRLNVIRVLADAPGFAPDAELAAWLDLRERLP